MLKVCKMYRTMMVLMVVALFAGSTEAQRLRGRRTTPYYSTPASSSQEGVSESRPAAPARETKIAPTDQDLMFSKIPSYHAFGLDYSEIIQALPAEEQAALTAVVGEERELFREKMEKKYPDVRPEVVEKLVEVNVALAEGQDTRQIGQLIRELAINPRELESAEVLAMNQELAPAIDPEEYHAVADLNRFRMRNRLRPCLIDLLLVVTSRGHSRDMRSHGFFSHVSPYTGSFTSRAARERVSASAENIYMGSSNGGAANNAWANSSGHRANMLGGHSRVGVGRVGGYFTQMFGR